MNSIPVHVLFLLDVINLGPVADHLKRILGELSSVALRHEAVVHETDCGSLIIIVRYKRVDCIHMIKKAHVRRKSRRLHVLFEHDDV